MSSVKSFVTLKEKYDRVVVLIDMDCFYCQVEEFLDEERLKNKPIAVVQYLENAGIIAVNYAARALGVTRHMREREAKAACPQLICVKVPSKNGKADLTKYRDAGLRVAKVLQTFTPLLERASVDEAYLDVTDLVSQKLQEMRDNKFQLHPSSFVNTFAVGYENIGLFVQDVTSSVDKNFDDVPDEDRKAFTSSKLRLLIGASIVNEIRQAVKVQTRYECSAGIAHNKILAKLTCGMNKPNKQTILPIESITGLFQDLAINKVKSLGGKLGEEVCAKLNVKTMADLLKFSEGELQQQFQGRVGSWLYWMARGIDLEKVTPKFLSKSIAVSKNFRGKNEISSSLTLKFWLKELAKEIVERLEKDAADCNRASKQMIVSFTLGDVASTRTVPLNGNTLNSLTADQIAEEAFETIKRNSTRFLKAEGAVIMNQNIKHLGISAGKFEDNSTTSSKNLQDLLKNHHKREVKKSPLPAKKEETATTSRSPSIASIKKFEMKSPKVMEKKVKGTVAETLAAVKKFNSEHAIKGMQTFHHWIQQIGMELCSKIENDSQINNRAPTEIALSLKHAVNGSLKLVEKQVPLDLFVDKVIDVDVIMETLKASSELFVNDELVQPITSILITAMNFEAGKSWNYAMKNENLEVIEPPAEVSENTEVNTESDEEFSELLKKEMRELEDETIEDEAAEDDTMEDEDLEEVGEEKVESEVEHDENGDEATKDLQPESPDYDDLIDNIMDNATEEMPTMEDEDLMEKRPQEPTTSAASTFAPNPSYMDTYAEFQPQLVPVDLLNPKEPCVECGKMIPKLDMIFHLDHHLAFQIATQQREEYRQQSKPNPQPTLNQSVKKVLKQKNKPAVNLIEKYAVKRESLAGAGENQVECEQCHKFINAAEFVSHLDYHFAQKLRAEEMKQENVKPQNAKKVEAKRKRPGSAQKNLPKLKSVKSYFTAN